MVSFTTAIKNFYLKAFKFKGRATRAEYWWAVPFSTLTLVLSVAIGELIEEVRNLPAFIESFILILLMIYILFNSIAMLSLKVRRFHDIGYSGWSLLWYALPCIGALICLILFAWAGDKFNNEYGESPYEGCSDVVETEDVNI